jgi:MoaA/NifB/PqqE/SkfB family radical SAM enzyme
MGRADWVRISLDYHDAGMFRKIRGGGPQQFAELEENLRRFAKTKDSSCNLGVNCVVSDSNNNTIYETAQFCRDVGVETVRFSPVWVPNFAAYHRDSMPRVLEQVERAKEELANGDFEVYESFHSELDQGGGLTQRSYNFCPWMQISPVMAADWGVYPCHNKAYDEVGFLGSIKDRSFKDLWHSPEMAERFREFDARERCQHQCSSDGRNRAIHEMIQCRDTAAFP